MVVSGFVDLGSLLRGWFEDILIWGILLKSLMIADCQQLIGVLWCVRFKNHFLLEIIL